MWTMAAPASSACLASRTNSSGVYGTAGLCSFMVMLPARAAVMMMWRGIAPPNLLLLENPVADASPCVGWRHRDAAPSVFGQPLTCPGPAGARAGADGKHIRV